MYTINCTIKGVSNLLQHKFGIAALQDIQQTAKMSVGKKDYSLEWMDTMYVSDDGYVCQPASHLEAAMTRAAVNFKISGARGKSMKDVFRSFVYVLPDYIVHHWNGQPMVAPDASLLDNPLDCMSVSIMRVVVQRAAVARSRLQLHPGWELNFTIEVHNDNIQSPNVRSVLEMAGASIGIGDFRGRYGRFEITRFSEA